MKNKRGQVLFIIVLIILLLALIGLVYVSYQYIPGKPESLDVIIKQPKLETGNLSHEVKQFYPNMKFNHNSISYKIDSACSDQKKERMTSAFSELAGRVGVISFRPVNEEPDIEVSCSEKAEHSIEEDFFIAGEGGAKEIIQTGQYNVITNGIILLYDVFKGIECDWSIVELHELLHVFGFEHSEDERSIMNAYLESCDQKLDESIIRDLKELYSRENLADLHFEEVIAVKKGRYLDFNVTVKNSGVIDAKNIILSVFDDENRIEDFDLKAVPFGAKIIFQVTNLKLKSRSSKNIEIMIDPDKLVREIDEENNAAEMSFSS